MVAHRWTLLPDRRGASMHRTDPDRAGYVMCGRAMDPHAAIHQNNPGFDVCIDCATLLGEPVRSGFRSQATARPAGEITSKPRRAARPPAPRPAPAPPRTPAAEDEPEDIRNALAATGWVRLPGRLLHRPDPVSRSRVVCGKELPVGAKVLAQSPGDWEPCPACETRLRARLEKARQRGLLDTARQEKLARRAAAKKRRETQAAPLSGADLRRAWRSPGWVMLADQKRAHHPHPQRPGHVLCGRQVEPGVAVQRQMPVSRPCMRCVEMLHRQQENLGLRTIVITDPAAVDRYERARRRGSSVRAVRGGLPTLGRDR